MTPTALKTFYSNGKLLITGEYAVLDGALALALPTRSGQWLETEPNGTDTIRWKSYDENGSVWIDVTISISDIKANKRDAETPEGNTLITLLNAAHKANPDILGSGFDVVTKLTFSRHWGLGTSSTLINNVAQWFGINAYTLLNQTFGGSGYDIACAQYGSPLLYQLQNRSPVVSPVGFDPQFADSLHFIYLNQKQNSREAIAAYRERRSDIGNTLLRINELTNDALLARDANTFGSALEKHEALMAGVLGLATVQERLFPDFKGVVKSLGAWGGDFVLAVSEEYPSGYFKQKGFNTIIPYSDMIL